MKSFDDLPEGQVLMKISSYALEPFPADFDQNKGSGHLEMRVYRFLTGPQKGQFKARPHMGLFPGQPNSSATEIRKKRPC